MYHKLTLLVLPIAAVVVLAAGSSALIQYYNTNHHSLSIVEFTAALDSINGNGTCGNSSDRPMDVLQIQFMPHNKDIPELASAPWSIMLRFGRNADGTFYLYTYDLSAFFGKGANSSSSSTLYEPNAWSNTILSKVANNAFHCSTTSLNLGNSAQGTDSNSQLTFVNLKVIANARLNETNSIYSLPSEECTTSSFSLRALVLPIAAVVVFLIINVALQKCCCIFDCIDRLIRRNENERS
ncbi:hypothetical protein Ddc_18629 [Ditylenchus destructor]|nr:hypothetical protein Ddc_18629 [Ditylenchus destructor]